MLINFPAILDMGQKLLPYIPVTLLLTFGSMILACILGLAAAFVRTNKTPVLSQLATLYILICRALPPMIVLYIVFFGLPMLFMIASNSEMQNIWISSVNPAAYAIIGLGLHTGAYMAEIFRASIQSVPKGQIEAALAMGMTNKQAFLRVILPQAIVFATPMAGNQFLNLLKGTSIAFMITVTEMFGASTILASNTNLYLETYLLIAIMYWAISIGFEKVFLSIEYQLSYFRRGKKV